MSWGFVWAISCAKVLAHTSAPSMLFGSAVRPEGYTGLGSRQAPTRLQHWPIAALTTTRSPWQPGLSQRNEQWDSFSDPFEYFLLRKQWIFVLGKIGNRYINRTTQTMIKVACRPRCGADVHTSPVPAGNRVEHLTRGPAPLPQHAEGPMLLNVWRRPARSWGAVCLPGLNP